MISMARIQGHSLGHQGWQKPILRYDSHFMGQNGDGAPAPAPAPAPSPGVDFGPQFPMFPQPIYNFPVIEPAVPAPVAAPVAVTPTWLLVVGGAAAGIALALLLNK